MTHAAFDHATGEEQASRRLRPWFLIPWMLLVFLVLLACGQLALALHAAPDEADTRSNLRADYARWQFMPMAPLDPAFLGQLALDLGLSKLPILSDAPGCLLPGAGCLDWPTASVTAGGIGATQTAQGGGAQATPTATRTPAAGIPPTALPTVSGPPPSLIPSSTPTSTPITPSPTNTPETPTSTPITPSPTNTPETPTPTDTPIPPTPTNTPCPAGNCEPDIGTPDGGYWSIPPGATAVFNLTSPIVVDGDSDWDLVYYERQNGGSGQVLLDLVVVQIGVSSTGDWYVVFDWGGGVTANSNVSGYTEAPNAVIEMSALYGTPPFNTGILINVDIPSVPTGVYDLVSVAGPTPAPGTAYVPGDYAEVDAVEVLNTPTP